MDDRIHNLLRIIGQEIRIYRDLTEHARKKAALFFKGKAEAVCEYQMVTDRFNRRLRNLENELVFLVGDLCESFAIPREEFTLLKLADRLEQSVAQEIRRRVTLFFNIVRQLRSVSQRNIRLMEESPVSSLRPEFSQRV